MVLTIQVPGFSWSGVILASSFLGSFPCLFLHTHSSSNSIHSGSPCLSSLGPKMTALFGTLVTSSTALQPSPVVKAKYPAALRASGLSLPMAPQAQACWMCLGAIALAALTPGFLPLVAWAFFFIMVTVFLTILKEISFFISIGGLKASARYLPKQLKNVL